MKITIELDAEVKGKLPHVHEIRNVLQYVTRQLKYLNIYVVSEPDIHIDPEDDNYPYSRQ